MRHEKNPFSSRRVEGAVWRTVALTAFVSAAACRHDPQPVDSAQPRDGELVVGVVDVFGRDAVLEAVALDGYRFEYVAASSDTSHLVKVSWADGGPLSAEQTAEVAAKLKGRPNVRWVEVNAMRQPR